VDFNQLYLVTDKLDLATTKQIRDAEHQLRATLPRGYAEFLTTVGSGEYDGYVRVYSPASVVESCGKLRAIFKDFAHFWEGSFDTLSERELCEVIAISDTVDGDYVVFHPARPQNLYLLPSRDECVDHVGSSFDDVLALLQQSCLLVYRAETEDPNSFGTYEFDEFHYFDSGVGHTYADFYEEGANTPTLFKAILAHFVAMIGNDPDTCLIRYEKDTKVTDLSIYKLFMRDAAAMIQVQGSRVYGPRIFTAYDGSTASSRLQELFAFFLGLGLQRRGRGAS
jgi:hypothetical protein